MHDLTRTAILYLAAGRSQRFGTRDKLLVDLDGCPLGVRAARVAASIGAGFHIAICASVDGPLARCLTEIGFDILVNTRPERGLSRSLRIGMAAVQQAGADAALVCLADMPFVGEDHLRALVARFDTATEPVVASEANGIAMPPALFARSRFPRLMQLDGDQGARALLVDAARIAASAHELRDIDRPEDLPDSS